MVSNFNICNQALCTATANKFYFNNAIFEIKFSLYFPVGVYLIAWGLIM